MSVLSRLFTSNHAPAVDVHEAHRRQTAGALLVDVRERTEWQQGHAPDAVLIPLGSLPQRQSFGHGPAAVVAGWLYARVQRERRHERLDRRRSTTRGLTRQQRARYL